MKDILQKIRLPASPAEIAVADAVCAQLMALRPDSLRITLMHSEQKEATYNLGKGAGLQGPAGTPAEHFFTSDEAIGLVPFLLQENSNQRGYNIFITPFSTSVWYILLDDILPAKIAELALLRLTPQLLIESSPQRFQGIYLLPRECATKDEANDLFRLINARHGDPRISGLIHPFRAVGFRNRKSKYRQPNGFYPFAGMVWGGKPLPEGLLPLLNEVKSPIQVTPPKARRKGQQIPVLDPATDVSVDADTAAYAREHYRRLRWRYGTDYDRFKADFMLAERLLARQLTVDRVVAALVSFSPGIQERCGGKVAAVRRYVTKTLIKASVTDKGASND
jgi:RepB DNA-primase from phage plasmid